MSEFPMLKQYLSFIGKFGLHLRDFLLLKLNTAVGHYRPSGLLRSRKENERLRSQVVHAEAGQGAVRP